MENICSPEFIIFATILLGHCLGKIRIKGISLGVSGVLILAILAGVLLTIFHDYDSTFAVKLNFLSSLGVSLFIATVSLEAGKNLSSLKKSDSLLYFSLGVLTVLSNLLMAFIIILCDLDINIALLYGTFCGAMTSTPGLTVLCGNSEACSVFAPIGYSTAYLFGVIAVVVFIQMFKKRKPPAPAVPSAVMENPPKNNPHALLQLVAVILLGRFLGSLKAPIFDFSLGGTGGILLVGLIIGVLFSDWITTNEQSKAYRTLGLNFFFVGTGIPAGTELISCFQAKYFIYGIILTAFPILLCSTVSFFITKKDLHKTLSVLCGAMTSTPAFGVLNDDRSSNESNAIYSLAYSGALLTMVFSMKLFYIS